jgi:hypothetical protein
MTATTRLLFTCLMATAMAAAKGGEEGSARHP